MDQVPSRRPEFTRRHSTGNLRDLSFHDEPQVQLEHWVLNDAIPEEDSVTLPDIHSPLPIRLPAPLPFLTLRPESPEPFARGPGTPLPRAPNGRARNSLEQAVAAHRARRHWNVPPSIHEDSVAALHPPSVHGGCRSYCGLDMAWAHQAIQEAEASRGRLTPCTFRRSQCYDDDEHLTASWDPFWPNAGASNSNNPWNGSEHGSVESMRPLARVGSSRSMMQETPRSILQERPRSRTQWHEGVVSREGTRPISINHDIARLVRQLHDVL
ncbi:hypothetical protein F5Y09DRAFT_254496 [Xylaria sp. FL1042]|nr:hypothetical protein F5Y09DRAFT_254496 [Xylaria sp. FL1042]